MVKHQRRCKVTKLMLNASSPMNILSYILQGGRFSKSLAPHTMHCKNHCKRRACTQKSKPHMKKSCNCRAAKDICEGLHRLPCWKQSDAQILQYVSQFLTFILRCFDETINWSLKTYNKSKCKIDIRQGFVFLGTLFPYSYSMK